MCEKINLFNIIFFLLILLCCSQNQYSFTASFSDIHSKAGTIEVIIDNDDGEPNYTETGAWSTSASTGYNGKTYRYCNASSANNTATWKTYLGEGNCEIAVFYRAGTNRATSTKYIIQTSEGKYEVFIDQTQNNLQWVVLGTYPCKEGEISVTLDAAGSLGGSVVIADAVRFIGEVPLITPTPTPTPSPTPLPRKEVFVILASDTSVWNSIQGEDFKYATEFDYSIFTNPEGVYKKVFEKEFRNSHTDSDGKPFKITWYMHCGGWFTPGINSNSISTVFKIRKYWQRELDKWGDELGLHFHHLEWNGSEWVMADTFGETIWDYEYSVSQLVIDESIYPVSFRSGWNYMDNEYQNYLDKWIPFRMEEGGWMPQCIPYHPSVTNYRTIGTMKGWEARHVYMKSFTETYATNVFNNANKGLAQVVCVWSHQNESDYIEQIDFVNTSLHLASAKFPDVKFYYCTGKEAMNRWLESTDNTPPNINLNTVSNKNLINVTIDADSEIYQLQPWVAARDYNDNYIRIDTTQTSVTQWKFSYDKNIYDNISVVACDLYGNTTIKEVKDGSKRLTTQSEFYHCKTENIDVESSPIGCISKINPTPILSVTQDLSSNVSQTLKRSYWLGQKFIPKSAGISKIVFGANILTPSVYIVELRKLDKEGFPINNPDGLLASATVNADSGTTFTAENINYNGLILDGRSYAVIFKLISGNSNIKLHLNNPYPEGYTIRSYSLEWINIPEFDCLFQIYDLNGNLSINQNESNSGSPTSSDGYYITQTFNKLKNIAGIELDIKAGINDYLGLYLRTLLPNSSPDYNYSAIIRSANVNITSLGKIYLPLNWTIPENLKNSDFAISFVSPYNGISAIQLGYDSTNPYKEGKMFTCRNLTDFTSPDNNDLYFKLYTNDYYTSGSVVFEFDALRPVRWEKIKINSETPENTNILIRYRTTNTTSDLVNTSWSKYNTGSNFVFEPETISQYIQLEFSLISDDGMNTPKLKSFELIYDTDLYPNSSRLIFF